ncbi:unnamed protein product [Citrullus colocynthis]|uniref:Neprosin PEP catalytic domain-containing protein n=1 Tax=Citrullus colocynthis TaxID=252529 RepID=A0ABP0XS18_9ROSI
MAGEGLRKLRLLVLVVSVVVLGVDALTHLQMLSEDEQLELNTQLKQLNKPAIKSFKTESGDIIDCVDIYKQPSLDHPLLKNHAIQMKPTTTPKGLIGDTSKVKRLLQDLPNINSCPPGSVPIRRTTREDLIAARSFKPLWSDQATDNLRPSTTIDAAGYHLATLNYRAKVYGAKSQINVWNPIPSVDQYSSARCGCLKALEINRTPYKLVGEYATVQPKVFQNVTRLSTYWTADGYQNTGCYDQLCRGFIQIDSRITPGMPIRPVSTYNGPQYGIPVSIHQRYNCPLVGCEHGELVVQLGDKYIGYWPKGLLPGLENGATTAAWGGEIYSPTTEAGPAMGSGHFPEEGFSKSAFVNQIQVAESSISRGFVDPWVHSSVLFRTNLSVLGSLIGLLKMGAGDIISSLEGQVAAGEEKLIP